MSIDPMVATIVDLICRKNGNLKTYFDRFKLREGISPETINAAYYVWRIARFRSGADTTVPVYAYALTKEMAREDIRALDALAAAIAESQNELLSA